MCNVEAVKCNITQYMQCQGTNQNYIPHAVISVGVLAGGPQAAGPQAGGL